MSQRLRDTTSKALTSPPYVTFKFREERGGLGSVLNGFTDPADLAYEDLGDALRAVGVFLHNQEAWRRLYPMWYSLILPGWIAQLCAEQLSRMQTTLWLDNGDARVMRSLHDDDDYGILGHEE